MKKTRESLELLLFNKFREGRIVALQCYRFTCEGVRLVGRLGEETELSPPFDGSERIRWAVGRPAKSYRLQSEVQCPRCKHVFTKAIIVQKGKDKPPIIFGYEDEGC